MERGHDISTPRARRWCVGRWCWSFSRSGSTPPEAHGLQAALSALFLAVVVAAVALGSFEANMRSLDPNPLLSALLLAGLAVALMAGGWVARAGLEADPDRPLSRPQAVALVVVVGLGVFLRLWNLGGLPDQIDVDTVENGWIGLQLLDLLEGGRYLPFLDRWAPGNESLLFYVNGLVTRTLGLSVLTLRLPAAIIGCLTLPAIYLVGRRLFSAQAGLWATFLLAVSPWHIHLSRLNKRAVMVPLVVALCLVVVVRLLRSPRRKEALWLAGLAGLAVGIGLQTYEAFRAAPPALAAALLWVRWRQGALRRGAVELAVVVGVSVLCLLPTWVQFVGDPSVYLGHMHNNWVWGHADHGSAVAAVAHNAWRTGIHFLTMIPIKPFWQAWHVAPAAAVTPLFLFGLVGLVLARDRDDRSVAAARAPLVALMVMMALPFVLSAMSNYTPRRYVGQVVPFYLLAGVAVLGLGRVLSAVAGRRAVTLLGGVLVCALLASLAGTHRGMRGRIYTSPAYPKFEEDLARFVFERSREVDVCLERHLLSPGYLARLVTGAPGVRALSGLWPLPLKPTTRDLMVVIDGARWKDQLLLRHFAARRGRITLGEPDHQRKLKIYTISRGAMARRRVTTAQARGRFDGWLLVPRAGRFLFRDRSGDTITLTIDGKAVPFGEVDSGAATVGLSAGMHRIGYSSGQADRPIQWRPPWTGRWSDLPPGHLWRLPKAAEIPVGPPLQEIRLAVTRPTPAVIKVAGEDRAAALPVYQSMALGPEGVVVGRSHRHPVVVLDRGSGRARRLVLDQVERLAPGRPPGVLSERPKAITLALAHDALFVLHRTGRRVGRFDRSGKLVELLPTRLVQPMDLAVNRRLVMVADRGRGEVLAWPLAKGEPFPLVFDARPVAVAATDDRMAYLDQARGMAVMVDLGRREELWSVPVPQISGAASVGLAPDGRVVVVSHDPNVLARRPTVLVLTPDGKVCSWDHDPALLAEPFATDGRKPVAAQFDRGKLRILTRDGRMMLFRFGGS